jgi:hypothetical protein
MPIWIAKVAGIDSPRAVMRRSGERGPGRLRLGEHGIDLGRAGDCLSNAELTGLRWAEFDRGILR